MQYFTELAERVEYSNRAKHSFRRLGSRHLGFGLPPRWGSLYIRSQKAVDRARWRSLVRDTVSSQIFSSNKIKSRVSNPDRARWRSLLRDTVSSPSLLFVFWGGTTKNLEGQRDRKNQNQSFAPAVLLVSIRTRVEIEGLK